MKILGPEKKGVVWSERDKSVQTGRGNLRLKIYGHVFITKLNESRLIKKIFPTLLTMFTAPRNWVDETRKKMVEVWINSTKI